MTEHLLLQNLAMTLFRRCLPYIPEVVEDIGQHFADVVFAYIADRPSVAVVLE
jgi:hypothetical protein